MAQSATSEVSPLPMEIAPGCDIMQLHDEVFHHLLRFVSFDEIKNARLVNKHWRQIATNPLRRLSKEIRMDHRVFDCVKKMNDGQFPVYRLEVKVYDDPDKMKVCNPYFSGICAWVKELTLKMEMDMNNYDKSGIPKDTITNMFPRDCIYKDLTHFNLRLVEKSPSTRNSEFWQRFRNFIQNIFQNAPNLREVKMSYLKINRGGSKSKCEVIEDFCPNSNSGGTSKLRCIDMQEVPLANIDLTKWSTLNLKLRKLAINLPQSSDLIALLGVFLETQSGTLKELTLNLNRCNDEMRKSVTFTFPRMDTLEQLVFTGWNKGVVVTFPDIDYIQLFPSLKKLDIGNSAIEWRDFLDLKDLIKPTSTVEELIFPWNGMDPTPVVTTSRIFPSLRKLEVEIVDVLGSSRFMKAVCETMPNLEVLSLTGRHSDESPFENYDYLITGMEFEVCNSFQGVMTETWTEVLKTTESWSMARLQNLKTLKLSTRNSRLICFSRLSFHVFQEMNSLKCLDLNGSANRRQRAHNDDEEEQRELLADLREKFVVL